MNIKTKITGHRGAREILPENTLLSFARAVELGAERIELDVHASRDDRLVVHHDFHLGSTDNGEGLISERDWGYLKTLDTGSWFSGEFAGLRIPLLEEVFAAFGDRIEYEVELKGLTPEFLRTVLEMVARAGLLQRVEFTSHRPVMLMALARLNPAVKLGFFVQEFPEWMGAELGRQLVVSNLNLGGFRVAHYPAAMLGAEDVRVLHAAGFEVHAADCNTEERLKHAFELGVDQISTDRVELALKLRGAK